jgi:hypothetical protein
MAFKRPSGILTGGLSGLTEFAGGATPTIAEWNANFQDPQETACYALLAGILAGGVCTDTGLTVVVPNGTVYFARQVWLLDASLSVSVPDDAVTYLWCTSDGDVVLEPTTGIPAGYDGTTACLLCKATASTGVVTIDNTVQHKGRVVDLTSREVVEPNPIRADVIKLVPRVAAPADDSTCSQMFALTDTGEHFFYLKLSTGDVYPVAYIFASATPPAITYPGLIWVDLS